MDVPLCDEEATTTKDLDDNKSEGADLKSAIGKLLPTTTYRKRGLIPCVTSRPMACSCGFVSLTTVLFYFFAMGPIMQTYLNDLEIVVTNVQLLKPVLGGDFIPVYASGDLREKHESRQMTREEINEKMRHSSTKIIHRFCLYCDHQDLYVRINGPMPLGMRKLDVFEMLTLGVRQIHRPFVSLHSSLSAALDRGQNVSIPTQMGFPGRSWLEGDTGEPGPLGPSQDYVVTGDECTPEMPVWIRYGRDFVKGETVECPDDAHVNVKVVDLNGIAYLAPEGTFERANVTLRFLPGHVVWLDVSQLGHENWLVQWERATVLSVTTKNEKLNTDEKYIDYQSTPTYTVRRHDNTTVNVTSQAVTIDAGQSSVMYYFHMNGTKPKDLENSVGRVQVISHLELENIGPATVNVLPSIMNVGVVTDAGFQKFGEMTVTKMRTSLKKQKINTHLYVHNTTLFRKVMTPQFSGHNVTWHVQGKIICQMTVGTWGLHLSYNMTIPGAALSNVSGSLLPGHEFVARSGNADSIKLRVKNERSFPDVIVIGDKQDPSQGLGFFIFDLLVPEDAMLVHDEVAQREALDAFLHSPKNKDNEALRSIYDKSHTEAFAVLLNKLLLAGMKHPDGGLNVVKEIDGHVEVVKFRISGSSTLKPTILMQKTVKVGRVTIPNFKAFNGVPPDTSAVSQLIRTESNAEQIRLLFENMSQGKDTPMMLYGPVRSFLPFFELGIAQDLLFKGLPDPNLVRWIQVVQSYMSQGFPVDCKQLFDADHNRTDLDGLCVKSNPKKIRAPGALSGIKNPFNIPLGLSALRVDVSFENSLNYTAKFFKRSKLKGFDLYECTNATSQFTASIPNAQVDFGSEGQGPQSSPDTSDNVRIPSDKLGSMLVVVKGIQQAGGNNIYMDPGRHTVFTGHEGICAKETKSHFSTPKGSSCCFAFMPLASSCRGWRINEQRSPLDADTELMKVEKKLANNTAEARRIWIEENLYEDLVNVNGSLAVRLEHFVVPHVGFRQQAVPLLGQRRLDINFGGIMNLFKDPTCEYITVHTNRDSMSITV